MRNRLLLARHQATVRQAEINRRQEKLRKRMASHWLPKLRADYKQLRSLGAAPKAPRDDGRWTSIERKSMSRVTKDDMQKLVEQEVPKVGSREMAKFIRFFESHYYPSSDLERHDDQQGLHSYAGRGRKYRSTYEVMQHYKRSRSSDKSIGDANGYASITIPAGPLDPEPGDHDRFKRTRKATMSRHDLVGTDWTAEHGLEPLNPEPGVESAEPDSKIKGAIAPYKLFPVGGSALLRGGPDSVVPVEEAKQNLPSMAYN